MSFPAPPSSISARSIYEEEGDDLRIEAVSLVSVALQELLGDAGPVARLCSVEMRVDLLGLAWGGVAVELVGGTEGHRAACAGWKGGQR